MEGITFRQFDLERSDEEIATVHELVSIDLGEPYSGVVYHYFLKNWPTLAIIAEAKGEGAIGVIVGSLKTHHDRRRRGYVAMLTVSHGYRGRGIAKELIRQQVEAFKELDADEITLEAECSNVGAVSLYESQGFIRTRRMYRYYFSSSDAFRLVLPLTERSVKSLMFLPPLPADQLVPSPKY